MFRVGAVPVEAVSALMGQRIKAEMGGIVMPSLRMPAMPRLKMAAGGSVGSGSSASTGDAMRNFGTLTLSVGGDKYPAMVDVDVANALERQIGKENLMGSNR